MDFIVFEPIIINLCANQYHIMTHTDPFSSVKTDETLLDRTTANVLHFICFRAGLLTHRLRLIEVSSPKYNWNYS